MKVISIVNNKGGIGKTTTTINIGALLAEKGKTLIIDIDPQANASSGLGIKTGGLEQTVYNVLTQNVLIKTVIEKTEFANLDILPSNIGLSKAENELISNVLGSHTKLKLSLKNLASDDYEYILIDCPPSVGILTINALMASTDMIIPIEPEFYALQGIKILNQIIERVKDEGEHNINLLGVLVTKSISTQTLHQQVIEQIRTYFGKKVFKTIIKKNVAIGEAAGAGQPISVYDSKSPGAIAYKELVEKELLPLLIPKK